LVDDEAGLDGDNRERSSIKYISTNHHEDH